MLAPERVVGVETGSCPHTATQAGPRYHRLEDDVVATLYVISRRTDPVTMVAGLRAALESCPDALGGVSELPNGCGVAVRLLGPTSKAVQTARATAWNAARLELLGTPAPTLRKG